MLVDMLNIERYKILLEKEIVAIEKEEGSLPKAYREGMRFGYILAATQWHGAGLLEGWNDHIKKLALLMEPLGGKGDE